MASARGAGSGGEGVGRRGPLGGEGATRAPGSEAAGRRGEPEGAGRGEGSWHGAARARGGEGERRWGGEARALSRRWAAKRGRGSARPAGWRERGKGARPRGVN